ncbi:MAG TPA: alanine racemase [Steroidobacteraceae bacterium]|nr:alanine racemase [Steroidobacteraceae bacterium]
MEARGTEIAVGLGLASLPTPCLLLDEARMLHNIERLRTRLPASVQLRPHLKTAKSPPIAHLLMTSPSGPATVSTLREAEYFAACGVRDILYAVGLTQAKLDRVQALRAAGVDLSVVADNLEIARAIAASSRSSGRIIPALIEVDCDNHRAGVDPQDGAALIEIGRALNTGAELRGVMVHAGSSYGSRSIADIEAIAELERGAAVSSAQTLRSAGLPCPVVSVGSTPTALFGKDFNGVTEVRAGVYVFFDLVMAGLQVCSISDIALSVLSTIIDVQPSKGRAIIDAGWMAMSRDRGTSSQSVDQGYGVVCTAQGNPYLDLLMTEANQEHGVISLRPGSKQRLPELRVGEQVRILPNHACATSAQHDNYHVVNGTPPRVLAVWPRIRGW